MDYNIKPKQTLFKNRLFRSRLEARWACFFDKVGWDYEYEPCEINGYNPDFIIKCNSNSYKCNHIIVEIKPSIMIDNKFKELFLKKYKNQNAHLLILSDFPFIESKTHDGLVSIGIGLQNHNVEESYRSNDFYDLEMKCMDDFGSMYMAFDGMIFGQEERKRFLEIGEEDATILKNMWASCGNEVMFMKKDYRYGKDS